MAEIKKCPECNFVLDATSTVCFNCGHGMTYRGNRWNVKQDYPCKSEFCPRRVDKPGDFCSSWCRDVCASAPKAKPAPAPKATPEPLAKKVFDLEAAIWLQRKLETEGAFWVELNEKE